MAYSPSTRTVAEVVQQVNRLFGDESGVQLEEADVLRFINDAQDEIVKRNRALKAVSTTSSVVGQAAYTFAELNILQIESLHYHGRKLRNIPFAEAENMVIDPSNDDSNDEPWLWYEWAGSITLFPIPATVQEIKLYYTKTPPRVTTLADVISVPDKYYTQIVQYCLAQAYELEDDMQGSQLKTQQFQEGLAVMAEEERTAQNMTYPVINTVED